MLFVYNASKRGFLNRVPLSSHRWQCFTYCTTLSWRQNNTRKIIERFKLFFYYYLFFVCFINLTKSLIWGVYIKNEKLQKLEDNINSFDLYIAFENTFQSSFPKFSALQNPKAKGKTLWHISKLKKTSELNYILFSHSGFYSFEL